MLKVGSEESLRLEVRRDRRLHVITVPMVRARSLPLIARQSVPAYCLLRDRTDDGLDAARDTPRTLRCTRAESPHTSGDGLRTELTSIFKGRHRCRRAQAWPIH
jgi:hypothetical protein